MQSDSKVSTANPNMCFAGAWTTYTTISFFPDFLGFSIFRPSVKATKCVKSNNNGTTEKPSEAMWVTLDVEAWVHRWRNVGARGSLGHGGIARVLCGRRREGVFCSTLPHAYLHSGLMAMCRRECLVGSMSKLRECLAATLDVEAGRKPCWNVGRRSCNV